MPLYRTKVVQIEAFNVGDLIKSPEADWTGIPDWLRDACAASGPEKVDIVSDGVFVGGSKGWHEDFITREQNRDVSLAGAFYVRIRRADDFFAEFEAVPEADDRPGGFDGPTAAD